MAAGQFKTFFALIVAVAFGVVQVLCACLPSTDLEMVASTSVVVQADHANHLDTSMMVMNSSSAVTGHTSHDQGHDSHIELEPTPTLDCGSDDKHDGHSVDCAHCDGASLKTATTDIPSASQVELPKQPIALVAITLPSPQRAGMAATNLAGLRWRDPPRPTPITLKTVSLT
jgi:hypothetical protein